MINEGCVTVPRVFLRTVWLAEAITAGQHAPTLGVMRLLVLFASLATTVDAASE